jgi:hypothetical protein
MPNKHAIVAASLLVLLTAGRLQAQQEDQQDDRGLILYEGLLGNVSSLGGILRLDTTAGYSFGRHFSVDAGLPVYFVRPSTSAAEGGLPDTNGIGNAYLQFRLLFPSSTVNYSTVLTGAVPTGDKAAGLSTGRVTVDWTSRFDHTFSRVTPFGDIGFANTASDTPLFIRPYTTFGFVTHLEGGVVYRLAKFLDAGAGAYAIEPAGKQTAIPILSATDSDPTTTTASGKGSGRSSGEDASAAAPPADPAALVRDDGVSVWGTVRTSKFLSLQIGYTRSIHYELNALTFGIGANLGSVWRSIWSY